MSAHIKVGNYDEYGYPFIIIHAQKDKKVITGKDVMLSNIAAAKKITDIMKTSLGPKGLDKMLIDEDADIIVTNDGATILENMDVDHEVAKIMVDLAKTQDQEAGDGTTSVVVLAGALLEQAEYLVGKGIHPIRIADGFELAAKFCLNHLNQICDQFPVDVNNLEPLRQVAMTALGSKIVKKQQRKLAEIAVKAVVNVADFKNKEANLNWIKIMTINGSSLENSMLVDGVVLDRRFAHLQMPKVWENAKVAILSTALEIPRVENKIKLELSGCEGFKKVQEYEEEKYKEIIDMIIKTGANMVVCLNEIDTTIIYLLLQNGIGAIQRAIVPEIDALARATGAKIVPVVEKLCPENLGSVGSIRLVNFGGAKMEEMIIFEKCRNSNVSTIVIRGANPIALDEAKRSITDALCVIRNVVTDNRIVYGGGAAEISCSLAVAKEAHTIPSLEQYAFQSFAEALESIPLALAENCGYTPMSFLTNIKVLHIEQKKPIFGIDCTDAGNYDMRKQHVVDTLVSKKHQILLATQMVKMVLKIDEIRVQDKSYGEYDQQTNRL